MPVRFSYEAGVVVLANHSLILILKFFVVMVLRSTSINRHNTNLSYPSFCIRYYTFEAKLCNTFWSNFSNPSKF